LSQALLVVKECRLSGGINLFCIGGRIVFFTPFSNTLLWSGSSPFLFSQGKFPFSFVVLFGFCLLGGWWWVFFFGVFVVVVLGFFWGVFWCVMFVLFFGGLHSLLLVKLLFLLFNFTLTSQAPPPPILSDSFPPSPVEITRRAFFFSVSHLILFLFFFCPFPLSPLYDLPPCALPLLFSFFPCSRAKPADIYRSFS